MSPLTKRTALPILLSVLPGLAGTPVVALEAEEIVEKTAAFLEELAERDGFSGTVLIAKDGVPLLEEAHGYASLAYRVPNKVDTKFNLAVKVTCVSRLPD